MSHKTCQRALKNQSNAHSTQWSSHPKCDDEQTWVLQRKPGTKKSTCSGCLKKDQIDPGMLHLAVEGLLYIRKHNNVVQTVLRFCLSRKCVTDIRSKMNNIRNLTSMEIKEHESLTSDPLTASERDDIVKKGFIFVWAMNTKTIEKKTPL